MKSTNWSIDICLQLTVVVLIATSATQAQTRRATSDSGELYLVVKNGRFGYIDRNGRVAIQPRYEWAFPFSEGLAQVLIGGKKNKKFTAYIDKTGRLAIRPIDGSGSKFSNGIARVLFGASYLYIDRRGRWASHASYQDAEDCTEGLCAVKMETRAANRWGYISTSGAVIVNGQYDWAEPFHEGIARVGIMIGEPYTKNGAPAYDGKEGYIDKTGKPITELNFDKASDFSDGMAQVELKGKWGYIDQSGRIAISPQYDETRAFHENLAGVKVNGLWGFVDKTGRLVIPSQFEYVSDFSDGLAAVGRRGENFYIDRSGKVLLSPTFKNLGSFRDGLATFRVESKAGVLNKSGMIVLEPQFDSIEILSGGIIRVEDFKKGIGYADRAGSFFWPPTY